MHSRRMLLLVPQTPPLTWLERVIPMANPQIQLQSYTVDGEGVHLHFVAAVEGQHPSDVYLLLDESDLVPIYTPDDLAALIQRKLLLRMRASVAATILDGLVGNTWSV